MYHFQIKENSCGSCWSDNKLYFCCIEISSIRLHFSFFLFCRIATEELFYNSNHSTCDWVFFMQIKPIGMKMCFFNYLLTQGMEVRELLLPPTIDSESFILFIFCNIFHWNCFQIEFLSINQSQFIHYFKWF